MKKSLILLNITCFGVISMQNFIKRSYIIGESAVDCFGRLSYFELMKMIENVAGLHSAKMGMSMTDLKAKDNGAWVISKIAIHFESDFPTAGDKVCVYSYPTKPSLIKNERNFVLSVNGQRFASVRSLWCILDTDSRRAIMTTKLNTLPKDFNFRKNEITDWDYSKIDSDILDAKGEVVYEKVVELSDLDMNNHLNNCVYTKIVVDSLGRDYFAEGRVKSFEVHFLKEVFLKEKVEVIITKKENATFVVGKVKGENVFVARVEKE